MCRLKVSGVRGVKLGKVELMCETWRRPPAAIKRCRIGV